MKLLVSFLIVFYSILAQAEKTEHYQTWNDGYDQYVYIFGLENDLLQKLKVKKSRGPKWKNLIYEYTEDDLGLHEWASYWGERFDDNTCPHFTEEDDLGDYDNYEGWELRYSSVKKVQGSQKTLMYIAHVDIPISMGTVQGKQCIINTGRSYVFLNKLDKNGKPIFLGEWADSLPR